MSEKILNIEVAGVPSPDQFRRGDTGKQAFLRIEMNGWWRDHAIFNPKLFLEDEAIRQTLMKMIEDEIVAVVQHGLRGPAV